ncbi:protocadherin Fat 3-like [Ruditapes philippinarum]|uniref:protocadherin Fat 3-like n=1 Tax=Ruditapes philippinarum TaxID=129788 RepID=UPI00295ADDE0|nr:protocadherin Fat 3-like [Ruditapes philippinarum]
MCRNMQEAILSFIILKGLIAITLGGAPAPPEWTIPTELTFYLDYTSNTGCEEVTELKAKPLVGTEVTFKVVAEGPEGGFATERIDGVTGKLICDQAKVTNGGKATYFVNVRASDATSQEFKDISLVIIATEGLEYKGPTFINPSPDETSEKHKIQLVETSKGGDVVTWLSASDPDTAIALFTYSMDSSDATTKELFELVGNALKVKVGVTEGTFDYDRDNAVIKYPIVLEVSDGQFSSAVNTNIFITDYNDNIPEFVTIGNFDILESTPSGSSVYKVIASDADGTAPNNQITFNIQGSTDFSIDETTGVISVASGVTLDYDTTKKYSLSVKATDNGPGNTALSVQSQIEVNIITAPVFVNLVEDASVSVYENATSETTIFELTVTDKDNTGALTVVIASQTSEEKFRLDGYILKPRLDATFDGTTQQAYDITFKASDGTNDVLSAVLTVTVTSIIRVNPAVQRYISEDTPAGTQIARITADDFSDPSKVSFTMIGESSSDFELNESNGRVLVAAGVQLDYTKRTLYTLIVTTTDGFSSAETPLLIFLKTSPRFVDPSISKSGSTSMSIPENTEARNVIKILTATDEDGDELDFDILRQTPSTDKPVFEIIRIDDLIAGRSNTIDTFDVDAEDAILSYELELGVKDGRPISVQDTVIVTITITDINEPPTFPSDIIREYNIPETIETGVTIFTVSATDIDRTLEYRKIKLFY